MEYTMTVAGVISDNHRYSCVVQCIMCTKNI